MLAERAQRNPEGRAAELLRHGTVEGEFLAIDEGLHWDVLRRYPQHVPWRFDRLRLERPDGLRPEGFIRFVFARGYPDGDEIVLDRVAREELKQRFYPDTRPVLRREDPSSSELAANFAGAVAAWTASGFAVATREEYQHRQGICRSCEFWDAGALLGTGRCKKCGCSAVKLWMATSKCPDTPPRW